jgi:excinuclease ABC subunit A
MNREDEKINVWGARVHNLKNVDVEIPRNSLTVITGLSGSGKSSLAFDTLYAEGQRRYIETFSAYARNFLGDMERPDVDKITGLSPVISIEQKNHQQEPPLYCGHDYGNLRLPSLALRTRRNCV